MHRGYMCAVHQVVDDVAIICAHLDKSLDARVMRGVLQVAQIRDSSRVSSYRISRPYPKDSVPLNKWINREPSTSGDDLTPIGIEHTFTCGVVTKAMVRAGYRITFKFSQMERPKAVRTPI